MALTLRALALVAFLAVAALLTGDDHAAAAAGSPEAATAAAEAPAVPWPGGEPPVLQTDQNVAACAGATLAAGAFVSVIGTPVFGAVAALGTASLCTINIVTGGRVAEIAGGPARQAAESLVSKTLGSFLREALAAVLDAFFGALGPDGNVVSQTPAGLTYEMDVVVDMHRYAMVFAFICLGGIVFWGGVNVMLRKESNSPYSGPLELFGRVVLAMILVALSMHLMKGFIEVNNAAICYFGGLVEVIGDSGSAVGSTESFKGLCTTTESGELNVVHPPGFEQAFSGGDGLLDIAFGLAYGLVLLALIILMVMRIGLIDVLIVLAPIAALLWVLPQTQQWTARWTNIFPLTVFQQAAQMIVLALGVTIAGTAAGVVSGPRVVEAAASEIVLVCDPVPDTEEARLVSMHELCALHEVQARRSAIEARYAAQRAALDSHARAAAGEIAALLPNPRAIEDDLDRLTGLLAEAREEEFDAVLAYASSQSPSVDAAYREYLAATATTGGAPHVSSDRLRLNYEMHQDLVLYEILRAAAAPEFDCGYQRQLGDSEAEADYVIRVALCGLPADHEFDRVLGKLGHRVAYWQHLIAENTDYRPPDTTAATGIGDLLIGQREDLEQLLVLKLQVLAGNRPLSRATVETFMAQESAIVATAVAERNTAGQELSAHMVATNASGAPVTQEGAELQAEARVEAATRELSRELAAWLPLHLRGEDVNPFHGSTNNAIYLMFSMGLLWLVIQIPGILNGQALQGGLRQILPVAFGLKLAAAPMAALARGGFGAGSRGLAESRAARSPYSSRSPSGAFMSSVGRDITGQGGGRPLSPASMLARDEWNLANPDRPWSALSGAERDSSTQAMANRLRTDKGG